MHGDQLRSARELTLAAEWDDLAQRCPGYYLAQTHRWADAAWRLIAHRDYADWGAYQKTLSASLRHKLRRVRRRLAEKGVVTLGAEVPESSAALVDWMLERKKRWLDHQGLQSDWIGRTDYRDFLMALASRADAKVFALKLDGVPIAAQLATVDPTRFEAYIGVYDPQWSFYAPGQILTEHVLS